MPSLDREQMTAQVSARPGSMGKSVELGEPSGAALGGGHAFTFIV